MKKLKLPPTIRIARPDELQNQADTLKWIAEGEAANIVEGFVLHYNDKQDFHFTFFAEINVDSDRLWLLFKTLLLQLPEEICIVHNYKDEESEFTSYADKFEILNKLESFTLEITQDGLLEVGVLYNDESHMEEILVRGAKYVQYWGMDEDRFRSTMVEFHLYEVPGLKFVDEYPMTTESLRLHHPEAKDTREVLRQLSEISSR